MVICYNIPRLKPEQTAFIEFWERLPEKERLIVDVLRQIVLEQLRNDYKERITKGASCYYGKRHICSIWPASVPGGGFKKGVLLGFGQGPKLKNKNGYIHSGTNKKIYYRIIQSVEDIDEKEIIQLLKEAIKIDGQFKS